MLYEMNIISCIVVLVAVLPVWGEFTIEQLKSERFAYTVEARDSGLDLSKARYQIGDMVFDRNPFKYAYSLLHVFVLLSNSKIVITYITYTYTIWHKIFFAIEVRLLLVAFFLAYSLKLYFAFLSTHH